MPVATLVLPDHQAPSEDDLVLLARPVPGLPNSVDPVVLHHDPTRDLTYVWRDQSPRRQDVRSRTGGYLISRLSVIHGDREVAYLNINSTTRDLFAEVTANIFEWAEENTGAMFGFGLAREDGTTLPPEKIWARAYTHLRRTPPSMQGKNAWGAYSNSQAPTDPTVLAAEIAEAAALYRTQARHMLHWLLSPFVDYSHVDYALPDAGGEPTIALRGTGVGRQMYLLAAQHLAETRDTVLRGSSLQSPEAQALWQRLVADPTTPTRRTRRTWRRGDHVQTNTYWCLDYTRAASEQAA